ncbi:MAG: COX15/CtaA family protein [Burkholderiaceae bacterium]
MAKTATDNLARRRIYQSLVKWTVVLTLCLIMVGAWVRLTDAGLGCPDWPGCYGHFTPAHAAEHIGAAVDAQGGEHGPVSMGKAWREMGHRYIAMLLGLLIIGLAWLGWRHKASLPGGPWLATVMVGVVILQGLFGKWTVTLLLKPAIVTGHLIGGMLTLALLTWLWQRQVCSNSETFSQLPGHSATGQLRPSLGWLTWIALIALSGQIILGGWTSTNYAALACTDLPTCHGVWWPQADFSNAFHLLRELGRDASGELLSHDALTAIHLSHRMGAIVATICVGWLGFKALGQPQLRQPGFLLILALIAQVLLGLSNVVFSLPLAIAVAHNGMAAILLMLVVVIKYRVSR